MELLNDIVRAVWIIVGFMWLLSFLAAGFMIVSIILDRDDD